MVLMTMIARIADGLPLVASMQDDEQVISLVPKVFKFEIHTKDYICS
jgi:hypothetical protein